MTLKQYALYSISEYQTDMLCESITELDRASAWEIATGDIETNLGKVGMVYSTVYDDDDNEHEIQLWLNLVDMTFTVDIDGKTVKTKSATSWYRDERKYKYISGWDMYYSLACDMAEMWG